MCVLQIKELYKSYPVGGKEKLPVIKGMNLEIKEKEMAAVMGSSGCGKTTLIHLICGIERADEGNIFIKETNVTEMGKSEMAIFRRNHIGLVFQDFNLLDSLNVKDNILLPLFMENISEEEAADKLHELSRILSIEDILEKNITEISGGQKQRAAIARSLIHEPQFVLADEPTGNLDAGSTEDVMEYLSALNEKMNMTLLMVTHDSFAASYCSKVIFLKEGKTAFILEKGNKTRDSYLECIYDVLKQNRW